MSPINNNEVIIQFFDLRVTMYVPMSCELQFAPHFTDVISKSWREKIKNKFDERQREI